MDTKFEGFDSLIVWQKARELALVLSSWSKCYRENGQWR
jgi:hypothetical protein